MPAKDRLGESLADRVLRQCRYGAVLPDCRQNRGCAGADYAHADVIRVADNSPDALAVMLTKSEETLAARRQHADAKAFQLPVEDVMRGPLGARAPGFGPRQG